MARTSSLNCLSCGNPYPPFTEQPFFSLKSGFVASPSQKSAPRPRLGSPWTWYRPISGLWREMGTKMAEKWILASPEKWGKHGRENEKNGPKFHFRTIFGLFFPFSWPFFLIFRAIFPPFFRRGQNPFFGHFRPHFGPEARNGSIPGPLDSKPRLCFFRLENGGVTP